MATGDVHFVDTDVIIRLLTSDDPVKQKAARKLFLQVEGGELHIRAPDTVIADAVYVLASRVLYNLPRAEVRDLLIELVRIPGFRVENRQVVLHALDIYGSGSFDFGDAMIAAWYLAQGGDHVYSYDHDFDRINGVSRLEPEP